ncbi:DUF3987 domain-containing protein [Phycobacter sp. K97]|uniref:DUF3987 domain-containing protein n=1 Tax=Phycobacter sedimenti TaxID=3133977 RepID=UPI00311EBD80
MIPVQEIPFAPDWPSPSPRLLRALRPAAPALPVDAVFDSEWARWLRSSAESKSAPVDYVVAGLLAASGTAIGNTRWASPWQGWAEPPVLWTMAIGSPSSNKSPGLDAVLAPLKQIERDQRAAIESEVTEWRTAAELAKIAESAWREQAKAALKDGSEPPARPEAANLGAEPFPPRLTIADGTVERLAVIAAKQPRGTLLARDELAGWLQGMTRYSGGGSDRPFWLEAYGGRSYTVERMGREPVHIDRLSIGVTGGIQPDRLKSLLMQSDDDGLLARFLPIWPEPVALKRPLEGADNRFFERALGKLHQLKMLEEEGKPPRPWLVAFSGDACSALDAFRTKTRTWEEGAEGLLLSFVGKLPGLAVRLSLVLSYLDWAASNDPEPLDISRQVFVRAAHMIEAYVLPMARRAYADSSVSKAERSARRVLEAIRRYQWQRFTSRELLRLDLKGLSTVAQLNPALTILQEGDVIRPIEIEVGPRGGRPSRMFAVNPALLSPHPA